MKILRMAQPIGSPSTQTSHEELVREIDMLFLLIMAVDVYFMQSGFLILECGAIPRPNMTFMLLKNLLNSFVGSLSYWLIGYSLAYGEGGLVLGEVSSDVASANWAHWFFQLVFAATATTIVSGAIAENVHPVPYMVYSFAITAFIYPVVTHWAWTGEGWLSTGIEGCCECIQVNNSTDCNATFTVTYQDFAGSGVVHLLAGTTALMGAVLLGHTRDELEDKSQPPPIPCRTVPLAALGAFILFFGFLAFNGGSQGSITNKGDAEAVALAMVNTFLCGATAGLTSLAATSVIHHIIGGSHKFSFLVIINGSLTGMVAVCAGCNIMQPWAAAINGIIAGLTYKVWSFIIIYFRIDDPLEAVPVHAGGGLWGVIAAALLTKDGVFFQLGRKSVYRLAWHLIAVLAIAGWAFGISLLMFGLLRLFRIFVSKKSDNIENQVTPEKQPSDNEIDLGVGIGEEEYKRLSNQSKRASTGSRGSKPFNLFSHISEPDGNQAVPDHSHLE